jgi:iron-sulfur cluster assembly protein
MILLTDSAIHQLKTLTAGRQGEGLRLAVERGGCAGMQYVMKIDSPRANDLEVQAEGALVVIDPDSLVFIDGSTLDYKEDLNDSGFRIVNPQAARTCGCGTSFETGATA